MPPLSPSRGRSRAHKKEKTYVSSYKSPLEPRHLCGVPRGRREETGLHGKFSRRGVAAVNHGWCGVEHRTPPVSHPPARGCRARPSASHSGGSELPCARSLRSNHAVDRVDRMAARSLAWTCLPLSSRHDHWLRGFLGQNPGLANFLARSDQPVPRVHHFLLRRRAALGKCCRTSLRTRRAMATALRASVRGMSGSASGYRLTVAYLVRRF